MIFQASHKVTGLTVMLVESGVLATEHTIRFISTFEWRG